MEMSAGESNDVVSFPEETLAPFPLATDLIRPPDFHHHHHQPVQKLRPVRFNRNGDLGFLSHLPMEEEEECGGLDPLLGNGNGNGCGGGVEILAVQQMKSEFDDDCFNIISQARVMEAELSSSLDDSESSEGIEEPLNRKRKRVTRKSLALFLEDMVRKLMDKQDQMYKQLIEMIEKKEQERIIREEAWKQQEIERAKRDEEVRAEQTSKSLALISFLKNLLGDEFHTPKSSEISSPVEGEVHGPEHVKCDPSNRRWPKSEVQALITVRTALDHKFLKGAKGSVWEEVAAGLANLGYIRNPRKCKEKWENINKYYKRTIESGKTRPKNNKSCPYFRELDILYNSELHTHGTEDCTKNETESKNMHE